jgi:hypothetical protein
MTAIRGYGLLITPPAGGGGLSCGATLSTRNHRRTVRAARAGTGNDGNDA